MKKRKSISKKTRFEIFKRDSFTCQYCGKKSPDTILNVDHIKPVAEGGTNATTNLITSCFECNSGKWKVQIGDHSVIEKQRAQLEELQARREQIEMMMEWHDELSSITESSIDFLATVWAKRAHPYSFNENGRTKLRRLLKKYRIDEIASAMESSAMAYIKYNAEGGAEKGSVEFASNKLEGICRVGAQAIEKPHLKDCYYVRGILRNRCGVDWAAHSDCMEWMESGIASGMDTEQLRELAVHAETWGEFRNGIEQFMEIH